MLELNFVKEFRRCVELKETCGGLCISNENAQKVTVDLLGRLEKFKEAYEIPGSSKVFHTVLDLPTYTKERVQTVVQDFKGQFANTPSSPIRPTTLFRDPNPVRSSRSSSGGGGGRSPSPPGSPREGPPFPPNPPRGGGGGDRMRIFPSLLRKKARSWYNHETMVPTGIDTWAKLREKFLKSFRELEYNIRVLTKLQNLQRERKENLRDYTKRFQDLLDRIPKTGDGMPYSTQQAIDWYVTGLPREMETYCRRCCRCDTIDDVIVSAKAYETSTLNRRRKDRSREEQKSKGSRRKRRAATPSSSESSSSSKSSESEDEKARKKANKEKNRRMVMPKKVSTSIISKVYALAKNFADLKVYVVGNRDKWKSPTGLRSNRSVAGWATQTLSADPINQLILWSGCQRWKRAGSSEAGWATQTLSADPINLLILWSGCRHGKRAGITWRPRKKQHT
ncbi:hypothetical protein AXG93_810s1020 [Marchantia polymorpha subsp. ruderalis]|uniref:Retrotransposon gag domain-containing protein n=1 Tax=Marchantia polymorpha subsp. ruderalis TaxID=1480154 RepID=A0A176WAW8_MARPO|nr:hypothetical protein AXG93_810s1020 [Marchantia polymorpha subsp. ruderalis]